MTNIKDKGELLTLIAYKERERLGRLSDKELEKETNDWFIDCPHVLADSPERMRHDLLNDFMMYREEDTVAEWRSDVQRQSDWICQRYWKIFNN